MYSIKRTENTDNDFRILVKLLDEYLSVVDRDDHAFYDQYNHPESLPNVVVVYKEETPVACGAIKVHDNGSAEVKRMFVKPEQRRNGIAAMVLQELERWSLELNLNRCILETGKRQVEAIGFYKKSGYQQIDNFGSYAGVTNSLCFEKKLNS